MVNLAQGVASLLARSTSTGWRVGTVQAIDTTSGTLTLMTGGEEVAGVPWQASAYSPVVGDRVTVMWDRGSGMFVTGTLSTVRMSDAEQVTVEVSPRLESQVIFREGIDAEWHWDQGRDRTPYGYVLYQGRGWDSFIETTVSYATYLDYPPLSTALPSGATDPQVSVRIRRSSVDWNTGREPALVSPVIYAHDVALPTTDRDGPDPYFATEVWRPGALTFGDEVIYPLPQEWQDGLLNGSLTGLATYSEDPQDFAILLHDEPYVREDGTPASRGTPGGNAHLLVTYTPPPE